MIRRRGGEAGRAWSISQLESAKFDVMDFDGEWLEHLGRPELTGSWLVAGNKKNGKTAYCMQLAKYLTRFARVGYNSLEEGASETIRDAVIRTNFTPVERHNIIILDKEPVDALRRRLDKKKSPRIVFIDSVQYSGLSYRDYISLKDDYRSKLFIWLSHLDGKQPAGEVAKRIAYDANIYIPVVGFKALPQGRYGGGKEYVIWHDGAARYW